MEMRPKANAHQSIAGPSGRRVEHAATQGGISPLASATGMNSAGRNETDGRVIPARKRLEAWMRPVPSSICGWTAG